MRKLVALGAVALVALSFIPAQAQQAVWKSVDLPIRTNAAAYASPGYRDSIRASIGNANMIDTTAVFAPDDWVRGNMADSLQYIAVQIIPTAALASGESLYVALMGGAGGRDLAWTDTYACTPGTGEAGGFVTAASVITEGGLVLFGGGNCGSGTSGGVSYPVAAFAKMIYGGWGPYPALRVKIQGDASAVFVDNSYRVRVWYWAYR